MGVVGIMKTDSPPGKLARIIIRNPVLISVTVLVVMSICELMVRKIL
jgi:hypothetical protein